MRVAAKADGGCAVYQGATCCGWQTASRAITTLLLQRLRGAQEDWGGLEDS